MSEQIQSPLLKTLILGHGRKYEINNIRCSLYPVINWFYNDYTCVDIDPDVEPDIIYDLKQMEWTFCEKNEYDLIVDTGGLAFCRINRYDPYFKNNIEMILNENGLFYGWNKIIWKKIDGKLINVCT